MADPVFVSLPKSLDIRSVEELYEQLKEAKLKAMDMHSDIMLDAVAVNKLDAAAAQCLVSFSESVKSAGNKVVWGSSSFAFSEIVELLGVSEQLGI